MESKQQHRAGLQCEQQRSAGTVWALAPAVRCFPPSECSPIPGRLSSPVCPHLLTSSLLCSFSRAFFSFQPRCLLVGFPRPHSWWLVAFSWQLWRCFPVSSPSPEVGLRSLMWSWPHWTSHISCCHFALEFGWWECPQLVQRGHRFLAKISHWRDRRGICQGHRCCQRPQKVPQGSQTQKGSVDFHCWRLDFQKAR